MDDLVKLGRAVERDLNNGFPMTCERGGIIQQIAARIETLTADLAAAEAKLAQAVGLLRECADDLAAYVEHDFPLESRERYSSVKKRYERDMELVYETRAFLATIQPEGKTDDKA